MDRLQPLILLHHTLYFVENILIFYPYSDTYRGENAFSEPETKAVEDFILNQNNNQNFTVK